MILPAGNLRFPRYHLGDCFEPSQRGTSPEWDPRLNSHARCRSGRMIQFTSHRCNSIGGVAIAVLYASNQLDGWIGQGVRRLELMILPHMPGNTSASGFELFIVETA